MQWLLLVELMEGMECCFSFNPVTQQESVLLSFSDTNGSTPYGTVMQAYDKNLYGLTSAGGKYGNGVLFRYNITTGQYVVLFNFHDSTTGASPYGSLIQANDSLLYGTTYQGGLYNSGVLFSFNLKTTEECLKILIKQQTSTKHTATHSR